MTLKNNQAGYWAFVACLIFMLLAQSLMPRVVVKYQPVRDTLTDWNALQLAIAMTESEFKPNAIGNTKDYGIYQITPIYVAEVNRLLGQQEYTHDQAFDITKSVEMFNILQSYKNPNQDLELAIYYHNKASWYKKRVLKNYETVKRYETLRAVLQEYSSDTFICE